MKSVIFGELEGDANSGKLDSESPNLEESEWLNHFFKFSTVPHFTVPGQVQLNILEKISRCTSKVEVPTLESDKVTRTATGPKRSCWLQRQSAKRDKSKRSQCHRQRVA